MSPWRSRSGNRIPVVVERRRAGIVQRGKPIRAQLVDGDKSMWHTDPGAFVWAALEQLNPAAPATDSP